MIQMPPRYLCSCQPIRHSKANNFLIAHYIPRENQKCFIEYSGRNISKFVQIIITITKSASVQVQYSPLQQNWNGNARSFVFAVPWRHWCLRSKDEFEMKVKNFSFYFVVLHLYRLNNTGNGTFCSRSPELSVSKSIGTCRNDRCFLFVKCVPWDLFLKYLALNHYSWF